VAGGDLLDEVPASALAIYAHPDDPDVGCGGTLAAWSRRDCAVHVLLCTDGDKGTADPLVDSHTLARRRAGEAAAAGEVVGVATQEFLHYPDGELDHDPALVAAMVGVIRRIRPQVVLCPDPTAVFFGQSYFNHRDHRVTGWAALDAVAPAAALPKYFPDTGDAHQVSSVLLSGTLEPNVWVDIAEVLERKVRAISCHRTQFPDGPDLVMAAVRAGAEDAGRRAGVGFAEGFRRLRFDG